MEAIYICGITSCPPHPEIHKTALGAEDSVSWQYYPTALDAIHHLHESGYHVFGVEQVEHSIKLGIDSITSTIHTPDVDKEPKWAIVLGNEVKGVKQEVIDICDACIEIPQYGTKHSLNVSTAAGIVIWELQKNFQIK